MDQEIEKISKKLMKELDEDRYRHTQGVMYTSAALAMRYGADLKKALLAGLLHDCAKCIPGHTKIKMCEKYNLEISEIERKNPSLLHAKLGAYLAKDKYDIEDEEILMPNVSHPSYLAALCAPAPYNLQYIQSFLKDSFPDVLSYESELP